MRKGRKQPVSTPRELPPINDFKSRVACKTFQINSVFIYLTPMLRKKVKRYVRGIAEKFLTFICFTHLFHSLLCLVSPDVICYGAIVEPVSPSQRFKIFLPLRSSAFFATLVCYPFCVASSAHYFCFICLTVVCFLFVRHPHRRSACFYGWAMQSI